MRFAFKMQYNYKLANTIYGCKKIKNISTGFWTLGFIHTCAPVRAHTHTEG